MLFESIYCFLHKRVRKIIYSKKNVLLLLCFEVRNRHHFSNRIMNLNSRLEKIERNSGVNSQTLNNTGVSGDVSDLATNNEFIASVVDNIVNNTLF